jgi:hypothetical protein
VKRSAWDFDAADRWFVAGMVVLGLSVVVSLAVVVLRIARGV